MGSRKTRWGKRKGRRRRTRTIERSFVRCTQKPTFCQSAGGRMKKWRRGKVRRTTITVTTTTTTTTEPEEEQEETEKLEQEYEEEMGKTTISIIVTIHSVPSHQTPDPPQHPILV